MNKRARLIVTLSCHRQCYYCCNKQPHIKDAWKHTSLLSICDKYSEYILTGGEPLLCWDRTKTVIDFLRNDYCRIFLYTSIADPHSSEFNMANVIEAVDGITLSLHAPLTSEEIGDFMRFQTLIHFFDNKFYYLNIEQALTPTIPVIPSVWDRIKTFKPMDYCPIPEGEDLYRLMEVL